MNTRIQHQISQLKEAATAHGTSGSYKGVSYAGTRGSDALSQAIRTKKDANTFMAELKSVIKQAK